MTSGLVGVSERRSVPLTPRAAEGGNRAGSFEVVVIRFVPDDRQHLPPSCALLAGEKERVDASAACLRTEQMSSPPLFLTLTINFISCLVLCARFWGKTEGDEMCPGEFGEIKAHFSKTPIMLVMTLVGLSLHWMLMFSNYYSWPHAHCR